MRIAQVAPLYESVPPKLYGGAERVVSALTEELVRRGHDVTLFASGDSETSARLVPMVEAGIRLAGADDPMGLHLAMLATVYRQAEAFDVIHAHVGILAYPFAAVTPTPTIHTVHGSPGKPEHQASLRQFPGQRLVSISRSQRAPVAHLPLRWVATVYNGIRLEHFPFRSAPDPEPYLVFLGRISPEKGPDKAIEVARRAGMRLKVAAKIDRVLDLPWAREHFLPLLDGADVEFLGEVDERAKADLLGGARALLFPIDWDEPFGMVMAEALACGTPVIALDRGSVREVVSDGETGFVCRSLDEMVAAVERVEGIDRAACRRRAETCFSAEAMADGYEAVYRRVVAERARGGRVDHPTLVRPPALESLPGARRAARRA